MERHVVARVEEIPPSGRRAVYAYRYGREREYEITTGQALFDAQMRVMTYPVEAEGNVTLLLA